LRPPDIFIFPNPREILWNLEEYDIEEADTLISMDYGLESEEYRLRLNHKGFSLAAGSEHGIFYGKQTLEQLKKQATKKINGFEIWDRPDFATRGFLLDISRCKVPKVSDLKKLIELLASLKYNQLQLYTEHTFAFREHYTVWRDASPLTAQEVWELDDYCRKHYIELVPNFNSFGHFERWLKHDKYKYLADSPEGFQIPEKNYCKQFGNVLYPDAKALDFLNSLYDEFLPNFSSKQFNINCDEVWELEYGRSREACMKSGMDKVYLDFVLKIDNLVRKHDKRTMLWADVLIKSPGLLSQLSEDIRLLAWGYEAEHDFYKDCSILKESGLPFYVCPGTSAWNSFTGRIVNCLKNLRNAAQSGLATGAEGYLVTDWGDGGHHQYPPISWPGICAGAAFSWSLKTNETPDISRAIDYFMGNESKDYGKFLIEFGQICDVFKLNPRNRTPYYRSLFDGIEKIRKTQSEFTVAEVKAALGKLEKLQPCIPCVEMDNAFKMTWCALQKMLLAKGEKVDLNVLSKTFRQVISQHKELWLNRNRSGGFAESSELLKEGAKINTSL
jgi:hypothetical protein